MTMIYDITQNTFSGRVYPGDSHPRHTFLRSYAAGDRSAVSELAMNVHNATHIDAPFHRLPGGKAIDELDLEACVGECEVISFLNRSRLTETDAKRILLIDCETIDEETARLLVKKNVRFVGVWGQSVGSREVHHILLEAEVVILEGAALEDIAEGEYFLSAAPIKLEGCDGAPCRALLIQNQT